jgi:hypothetical protein
MLALFKALPTFIQALPEFLKLMIKIMGLVERFVQWSEKNKLNDWLGEVEHAIENLERADSPESKHAAARSILSSISKL